MRRRAFLGVDTRVAGVFVRGGVLHVETNRIGQVFERFRAAGRKGRRADEVSHDGTQRGTDMTEEGAGRGDENVKRARVSKREGREGGK